MPGAAFETLAVVLLALCLIAVVGRPWPGSEAMVAVPAAAIVVVIGAVPAGAAGDTLRQLAPAVGFLAAVLVFGRLCAEAGVFGYLGAIASHGARGRPSRLLLVVVALAAATTATLTLDATVVLLTPVVVAAAAGTRASRPLSFSCVRIANSGSLLLPVSNLTNLLAFGASRLSFGRFAALMALPWVVVVAGEWLVARTVFRRDLGRAAPEPAPLPAPPRYALAVVGCTVAGFVACSALHVAIAWAALAGCIALLVPGAAGGRVDGRRLIAEAQLGFCAFVLALGIVVDAVVRHGLGDALGPVVGTGTGLAALLGTAFLAAGLACALNNLPATLVLLPLVAGSPAALLAMLVGVNVGPNAVYSGSLANLLWRRIVPGSLRPSAREFHRLGLVTVPVLVAAATLALWCAVSVVGV